MRVAEVMTRGVESLDESSILFDAAQRMRDLDVGAIPVVRDGKPVGMLTDRDVVVRAAAERRDLAATTVGEVMTDRVVTVRETDDVQDAAEAMKNAQVRRVMVVDAADRLVGILSLGDLSVRTSDDELAEDTLEETSRPGHPREGGRLSFAAPAPRRSHAARGGMPSLDEATGAAAMGGLVAGALLGAGLAFLLGAGMSSQRRYATDQVTSAARRTAEAARRRASDAANRARGVAAESRAAVTREQLDDRTLRERVRATLGHVVSHAHAVHVDAMNGVVTLTGPVLAGEAETLLAAVRHVRGVRDVVDALGRHDSAQGVPGLG